MGIGNYSQKATLWGTINYFDEKKFHIINLIRAFEMEENIDLFVIKTNFLCFLFVINIDLFEKYVVIQFDT